MGDEQEEVYFVVFIWSVGYSGQRNFCKARQDKLVMLGSVVIVSRCEPKHRFVLSRHTIGSAAFCRGLVLALEFRVGLGLL